MVFTQEPGRQGVRRRGSTTRASGALARREGASMAAWTYGPTTTAPARRRRRGVGTRAGRAGVAQVGAEPGRAWAGLDPVDRTEDSPTWPPTCKVPALSRPVTTGEHRPGTAQLLSSEVNRDSPGHAVGPPTDPHGPRPDAGRLQGPGTDTGVQVRRNELCPTAPARWRTGRSWRSANRRVDTHTTEGR